MYLAGPNGVGKSVIIYTLTCLAKAHDWIVLYVPNCDEWATLPSEEGALAYLLHKFAIALAPHYNQPVYTSTKLGRTWGEILKRGMSGSGDKDRTLSILLDELSRQKDHPLLLVFDEVNALFTQKLPWGNRLAKEGPYFSHLAATINRFTMQRGWKVISGTGHEQFLAELPSGFMNSVRYLTPLGTKEFDLLMDSSIFIMYFPF